MKVVLLSFNFGQYCLRLAEALGREADVLLMLPRSLAEPHVTQVESTFAYWGFDHPRIRQPARQMAMARRIVKEIRRFGPDVIHYQHGHMWFNWAWPLLRQYPLVVTIHEARHHLGDRESRRTPQAIMNIGYRQADDVIVHGAQISRDVAARLHVSPERIHIVAAVPDIVLPSGASNGATAPSAAASSAAGSSDSHRCILFFGRIWPYKGLDYLIRAEPLITARVPDVRIVIAGYGEDLTCYRRLMVHPEHFHVYNEYISDDRLIALFSQASIVVLPYIDGSISGVVPIACTFGKPVVASTVGILPEMVEDGVSGLLVPPRDETALANALVRLLQDNQLREQLAHGAHRKAETTFSPTAVAGQTLAVYRRAIAGAATRR